MYERQTNSNSGGLLKEVILTPEGYEKLLQEIDFLRNDKRREVAERIRVAREFGDIAENAEYDDAKNEQAMLEHRIAQIEERLLSARVITKKEISKDAVSVGSKVRLRDMQANKTFEYQIVGSAEANPAENKVSNESPVGKAIMGRKKGEVVEVSAPRGRPEVQDPRDHGRLTPRTWFAAGEPGSDRNVAKPASRSRNLRAVEVVRLPQSGLRDASEMLARAFHDDPAWEWVLPDPERRAELLPWLFRVGFDVTAADVWTTPGEVRGAARWLPPGGPRCGSAAALRAVVTTPLRLGSATSRFLAYGRAVETLRAEAASGAHWYLAGIGVDPSARRQGIGDGSAAAGSRWAPSRTGCPACC